MALERAKLSLTKEIEEMTSRVDQANVLHSHAEKKIKASKCLESPGVVKGKEMKI